MATRRDLVGDLESLIRQRTRQLTAIVRSGKSFKDIGAVARRTEYGFVV
jgi:hypothetical protein